MKKQITYLLMIISNLSFGQISGTLTFHAGQDITLMGYAGFESIELAKSPVDSLGNFSLDFTDAYHGMAYLETTDENQLFVVLNAENIEVNGAHLQEKESIKIDNSVENSLFTQYAIEHALRENTLSGLKYVLPQYQNTPLFSSQKKVLKTIQKEIKRIEEEDIRFLEKIDPSRYVSWFLPLRKLLDDMPISAQRYTERIPKHLSDFRKLNFNDQRLYRSGIVDDLLETHYWLIENGGMSKDSMYAQMNASTDILIQNLAKNEELLNEVVDFLFNFLEKRSLFGASEYLAIQMLNQSSCTLNDDLANQLETYRKMKIGNTAPDLIFSGKNIMRNIEIPSSVTLSKMNTAYTLVVFGASWCHLCTEEIPKMLSHYDAWKQKGIEVVFVSLDTNEEEYKKFVKEFPWFSTCDFEKWSGQAVTEYHVFATPSMFLLDKNRKILLRPVSVDHMETWVKYKM
jgi:peroxiredoxin